MFDVSWEDPTSETVAQRRERKERDECASAKDSRSSSVNSANSNDSSRPQLSRLFAAFSKGGGPKKTLAPNRSVYLSKNRNFTDFEEILSADATRTELDSQRTIKNAGEARMHDLHNEVHDSVANTPQSTQLSNELSQRSNTTSWSSITENNSKILQVQSLAGNSFVTQTTETSVSPQDVRGALETSINKVHISTDTAPSSEEYTLEMDSQIFKFPKVPRELALERPRSGAFQKGKNHQILSPFSCTPTEWKPPLDWECVPEKLKIPPKADRKSKQPKLIATNYDGEIASPSAPQTMHLQRHIQRMEAASSKIMLERLREEWIEVADPTICQELELEKQLWMLTALKHLCEKAETENGGTDKIKNASLILKASAAPSKVLSLYESQASASFLATFTIAAEVHHLATSPLQSSQISNIYPLTVPTPHHNLPYGKLLFTSITCLTLPSILPSSSIPPLLKECHRILVSSGTLNLTIMDHSPDTSTMGPKLRAWLDQHLWLNLEQNFRCMSPGRLLPAWLKAAGFSYEDEGSKVTIMKLAAVGHENKDGELAELSALVGRMLWREIWGGYVEGKGWWWEDMEVLEECKELGTRWECVLVKAVKWI